jgi:hypothetical protein
MPAPTGTKPPPPAQLPGFADPELEKQIRGHPAYSRMEAQFHLHFGADKDFFRYLTDGAYATQVFEGRFRENPNADVAARIHGFVTGELRFFRRELESLQAFEPIDLDPIFDPLRGEVSNIAAQGLQARKSAIGRESAGAQTRAAEGLAGTGLGRSGVAAQQFSDISTRTQDLLAGAESEVETQRLQAMFQIGLKQAQTEYSEELAERNYTLEQINDALAFDRELFMMQFGAELQAELAADESSWFADLLGFAQGYIEFNAAVAGAFV